MIKKEMIRLSRALIHSAHGLVAAFKSEAALRLEIVLAIILIPIALFVLKISPAEKALLTSSVLLVLIVELINTAIETVVDRISMDHHMLSKKAKDIGSAAVLIAMINTAVTWLMILFF